MIVFEAMTVHVLARRTCGKSTLICSYIVVKEIVNSVAALEVLEEGDAADSEANYAAVNNKRRRSAVWDYFRKLTDTAKITGTSKCSICSENVKHGSNTSNLFKVTKRLILEIRSYTTLYNINLIRKQLLFKYFFVTICNGFTAFKTETSRAIQRG